MTIEKKDAAKQVKKTAPVSGKVQIVQVRDIEVGDVGAAGCAGQCSLLKL